MAKKQAPKDVGRASWGIPKPPRWELPAEAENGANQFLAGASKLIGRGKKPWEMTELEKLGMRLVSQLLLCFDGNPDDEYVTVLKRALKAFTSEPGLKRRRAWCVRAIAEWAERRREPEWQASAAARGRLLANLLNELVTQDDAFAVLQEDLDSLARRLDAHDLRPSGRRNKKSAERILAELIVEEFDSSGVLGLRAESDETDAAAIERIRKKLANDVDKLFGRGASG